MLKKLALGLLVILVVFLVIVALQPATYRVERSATITAPATAVFAHVNDFHRWDAWSPWAKLDPAMTTTYEGPAAGVGAIYTWTGNSDVGAGRMTITESRPPESITIKLEFIEPFASVATTTFAFQSEGTGTRVIWSMDGENNFMGKAFGLFVDMDAMIGGDFEKGLTQLQAAVTTAP